MPDNAPLPAGLYPFWFWNGRLEEGEVRRQIAEMAAKGFRGFYLHSRQGLRQPYMSESFLRMVDVAVEAAAEHGLLPQLYDEYPYPSGVAGGEMVLGDPQYMGTRLVQKVLELSGGETEVELPAGRVLDCQAFPLSAGGEVQWGEGRDLRSFVGLSMRHDSYVEMGLTDYNRKRFFASDPVPVLEVQLPPAPHLLVSSLQVLVTDHKYWGYYADVMNPAAVARWLELTHARYAARYGDAFGKIFGSIFVDETTPGWSALVPGAYEARYGEALPPLLPALCRQDHPRHLEVKQQYRDLLLELFVESFETPVRSWCRQHGIRYAGEKNNLRLSQLKYMDVPGCEPGHTKAGRRPDYHSTRVRGNARATASAAWFYEKEGSLCECFHSLGWSGTMQDARVMAEGLVQQGIRYLVPHGCFYTTHSLTKHDAPPSFHVQMPYWPIFGLLQERLQRLFEWLEGTWIEASILVLDPNGGLPSAEQTKVYQRLLEVLVAHRLDYHMVDVDILQAGRVADGRVHLRGMSPRVVLVPPMQLMEGAASAWLDAFRAEGGQVVEVRDASQLESAIEELMRIAPPSLRVEGALEGLQVVTRSDGKQRRWMLLNSSREAMSVRLCSGGRLREEPIDPRLPPLLDGDGRRRIAPFETVLVEEGESVSRRERLPELRVQVKAGQRATVRPLQANLLRLYEWEMCVDGKAPFCRVASVPLANQLQMSGMAIAPVWKQSFGQMPLMSLPRLKLSYRTSFDCAWDGPVELVMEPGSLLGAWRARVNDGEWFGSGDFSPTEAHVRGSLAVDISRWLRAGENALTVELETDRLDGGLRNALYLAGAFAVDLERCSLEEPRLEGAFEHYRANGLPYYAGVVEYGCEATVAAVPDSESALLWVELPDSFEDACEIRLNGHEWVPLPWSPRAATVPCAWIRKGANQLEVRVYTSLIRAFEGQWFDPVSHAYREVHDGD